jgi:HSP20 family protein
MAIVRWQPFNMRWPNIWDNEEDDFLPTVGSDNLDVYETTDEIVVKANVAGIPDEKVEITFEKGILWIQAEEESEEKKEDRKYYRKASRSYSYKVAVPGNVDLKSEPQAVIEKGVVQVTFKKAEEAKPKKITIKRAGV